MRVWRLCRQPFANLDGMGAELKGGRWNSPGKPVIYCAAHLSLTLVEVLVHLEVDVGDLPDDYVSVEIEVPDELSLHWFDDAVDLFNHNETQAYGDQWLNERRDVALVVPSVVVPKENNVCLNPSHTQFNLIKIINISPFQFDERLWK
jgi:RES domain-containing protein